jgi:hypothetical protein
MPIVILPKSVVYTTQPAQTVTLSTLTINRVVDLPEEKIVRCFLKEINTAIILWEGDDYDAAGQWSDADVQARLTAIFSA